MAHQPVEHIINVQQHIFRKHKNHPVEEETVTKQHRYAFAARLRFKVVNKRFSNVELSPFFVVDIGRKEAG